MNNVSLIGRLVKDPDLRYTSTGKAVSNFTLAVRNPFDLENADFVPCVAWGAAAELIAEKHEKGNLIGVDGRIQTRNYENNEGVIIYVVEVNVNNVSLIQTKDYADNQNNGNGNNGNGNGNGNKNNGNGNKNSGNGNKNTGNGNKNSGNARNSGNGNGNGRNNNN